MAVMRKKAYLDLMNQVDTLTVAFIKNAFLSIKYTNGELYNDFDNATIMYGNSKMVYRPFGSFTGLRNDQIVFSPYNAKMVEGLFQLGVDNYNRYCVAEDLAPVRTWSIMKGLDGFFIRIQFNDGTFLNTTQYRNEFVAKFEAAEILSTGCPSRPELCKAYHSMDLTLQDKQATNAKFTKNFVKFREGLREYGYRIPANIIDSEQRSSESDTEWSGFL